MTSFFIQFIDNLYQQNIEIMLEILIYYLFVLEV